ncbi:hypothetical protein NC652_032329 [Populus alba x Populus x berolinensis]|nr:hypothetical protein NC652_032329 [Populus alba x Populus x berolinensis]
MEIDLLKSATEDQMEMMMMIDKFPEFYGACNDVADHLSPTDQFLAASVSDSSVPHFNTDNPHIANLPPFMNLPSTLSFNSNNTPIQDHSPRAFFSSPSTSRWRGLGELPGTAKDYATPSRKKNSMAAMREMIFRIAAMQPIHIDPESVKPPKRRNVKISKDPQSVAARHRRERISERIRILQRLVPGGTKMDTASMLDEAIHYVKFLKTQVQSLERAQANRPTATTGIGFPVAMTSGTMANCNDEHFGHDKFLLDPKEASLKELVLLLFFSDVQSRKFVDCPEENRLRDINQRWLIFISILVQKILLSCREPLAQIGHAIEYWLNLISNNGGPFKLLLNYLKDKVVRPDESSATFRSAVGHCDWRVELDKSSKPEEIKYNSSLSLMAAKLSYENKAFIETIVKDHWNMEFLGSYDYWNGYQERASTQALIFQDKKVDPTLIVVAFRGTNPFDADDWSTDVDLSWYDLKGIGKLHRGFVKALGQQENGWPKEIEQGGDHLYAYYEIRQMLRDILLKNEKAKFILSGHSLGGALAILFVGVLALHQEAWLLERLEGVYTFGQPRVGDGQFGEFMVDKLKRYEVRYMRHVYSNDIVPRLPYDDNLLLFKHFGPCIYFNSFYKGKVMQEEPNKNYFSLLLIVPKYLNALWELIRSFIIPFLHGQDYRESWFMRLLRLAGLLVPGIPEHILQDYDNSTRGLGELLGTAND